MFKLPQQHAPLPPQTTITFSRLHIYFRRCWISSSRFLRQGSKRHTPGRLQTMPVCLHPLHAYVQYPQASHLGDSPAFTLSLDHPEPALQMIAKAVEAAAPSRERTAWYERKAHWEGTARRRQEARAAAPWHSVVHAQGGAAVGAGPGVAARWNETMNARGAGRRNGESAGGRGGSRDGEGDDDGDDDGYRLNKIQTVLAVAVMLVMAVFKLRSVR